MYPNLAMARLSRSLDRLQPHYDAVVVGSGYGGGVAASRLARAGQRVAVLERGREFLTGDFPTRFPDLRKEMQLSDRRVRMGSPTGLFDVRLGEDMHVLVGCGLGGGSLINAGVTLRPDPRVFRDTVWPQEIAHDGLLEEGFEQALQWIRPARDPRASERTKYRALQACGTALGQQTVAAPVAVTFAPTVNAAGIVQAACTGCGDCCSGCNVGAKNTVALSYIPDAARHGAEIFTHAMVRSLSKASAGGWHIHIERLDEVGEALSLGADRVVLAAGTLGSTEILLRSRERGLALSDRLGERFSANGDIIAFGYGARVPVNAIGVGVPPKIEGLDVGACVSGQIELVDEHDVAKSLTVQEGVMPSVLAPILPVLFMPNGRLIGALKGLISGVYKGPFTGLQTFFAVSHDNSAGRLVLEDGNLALVWPAAKDEPVYARIDAALRALVEQAGGAYVKNPLAGTLVGHKPATAHPLGGCCLGHDRSTGVVDHAGRAFDTRPGAGPREVHHGLLVVDGATVPRSLGANPLLTITALAERAMLLLARDRGWRFD
jgi:cholesterol oxidase